MNDTGNIADISEKVDLISRRAVLSLAKDLTLEGGIKHRCVDVTEIKELPFAQSDVNLIEYAALNYQIGHKEGYEQGKADARQEPFRINLNEWVKVKLTDLGKEIYYHQYDKLNKVYGREMLKPSFPSEDEDGYTRFQLWKFIQLYGAHIGMGAPNVIDPLEIVYEGEN